VRIDLHHEQHGTMCQYAQAGSPEAPTRAATAFRVEEAPAGWVWQTQRPLIIPDIRVEARWPLFRELFRRTQTQSTCLVPLTTVRRRLGTLCFMSRQVAAFDDRDLEFLSQVANPLAVAVENALILEDVRELKDKRRQQKVCLDAGGSAQHDFEEIVGDSPLLRRVLKDVETVAPTDATVLIRGETGTGKELIARAIHERSTRRDGRFVKVNCAAIPTGLLESELFGHEKGAFTGAVAQKVGRFELAHHGTLFLDEVGDIPLELQPKLLRVLQDQEFERLGGTQTLQVNVRVTAATHRDLAQMVAAGTFRSDLYYRLHVFPVLLPPLRERRDDIAGLVRHFARCFADRMGKRIESIDSEVMAALTAYDWPGNIRELENLIERAVILSTGAELQVPLGEITPAAARPIANGDAATLEATTQEGARLLEATLQAVTLHDVERQHILRVLRETQWVLGGPNGAAVRLGVKRSTLQWKMKKLSISRPR
jgi:formate hydrogenlyase transcriptional activator